MQLVIWLIVHWIWLIMVGNMAVIYALFTFGEIIEDSIKRKKARK